MKSIRLFLPLLAILATSHAQASDDVVIACKRTDERSTSICKMIGSSCTDLFEISDSKRKVTAVRPGEILPDYVVDEWSDHEIGLHQDVTTTNDDVVMRIRTVFDRLNGSMRKSRHFYWQATGKALTENEARAHEDGEFKRVSILARTRGTPETSECKVAQRAF